MELTGEESFDMDPFNSLPKEILQKILGYLPIHERMRAERVCKRWKSVSPQRVWKDIKVVHIVESERLEEYQNSEKFVKMEDNELLISADEPGIIQSLLSRAGQYIKKFIFGFHIYPIPDAAMLSIISAHCRNIESIDSFMIDDSAVEEFAKLLNDNKELRSISCIQGDNFIERMPLRDWKSLDIGLDIIKNEWDKGLVELIKNSPSLEKLHIEQCTSNILAAVPNCTELKTLYFPNFAGVEVYDQLMDPSLLNRLTCLKITGLWSNVDLLIDLLNQCINLESLSIPNPCRQLLYILEQAVFPLYKLESLELNLIDCTDRILIRFIRYKHLKLRQPSFFQYITESGIFKMIINSQCLEKLDISEMYFTTKFLKRLVKSGRDRERREILEIKVSPEIYKEALEICRNTRIHIIRGSDTCLI